MLQIPAGKVIVPPNFKVDFAKTEKVLFGEGPGPLRSTFIANLMLSL